MVDTYSGMFGNSPLGQSQKSLYDAISAIRGMPPSTPAEQGQVSAQAGAMALRKAAPGAIQQNVQQLTQQSGIPQLQAGYGDLSKIFQMYLHDTNLSSKYANPSVTGYQPGSGVPTQATYNQSPADILAGVTPPPGADGGFSGFTTPSANTAAMGAVPTQSSNIMDLVQKAIGGEQDIVGKNAQLASENYKAAIDGLLGLSDQYGKAQDVEYKKAQLEHLRAQTNKIYSDMGAVLGPNSPEGIADQFIKGTMDWEEIPDSIKARVTKIVKARGLTVDKVNTARQSGENSLKILDDIEKKWNAMSELEKRIPSELVKIAPAISPTRSGITSLFFTSLEPELRKATVGGRITQQEIQWIRNAILPGPLDTPESAKQKLDAVRNGIKMKLQGSDFQMDSSQDNTGNNDPLGIR